MFFNINKNKFTFQIRLNLEKLSLLSSGIISIRVKRERTVRKRQHNKMQHLIITSPGDDISFVKYSLQK